MKVSIRPLIEDDMHSSYLWRNDPRIWRFTRFRFTGKTSLEDELAWFRVISARTDEYRCAILSDGEYIGNTYLTGIHAGEAEYHIFIGNPSYWRQGIAAQVTDIVLDYAKWTLGIKKITAEVHSDNLAPRRMLESLGFRIFSSGDDGFLQMVLELDALSETINKIRRCPDA